MPHVAETTSYNRSFQDPKSVRKRLDQIQSMAVPEKSYIEQIIEQEELDLTEAEKEILCEERILEDFGDE